MLVGIAPGEREVEAGRPFVGPSGKLLDAILISAGWHRDKTFATNLICHWNNAPTQEELTSCAPRFEAELTKFRPKVIVSLGNIVTERLTGPVTAGKKNVRGSVLWDSTRKAYVITTRHPAAVLRSQSMSFAQDILRDLEKIPLVLQWPDDGSIADIHYQTVNDVITAQSVFDNWLSFADGPVVIDIETASKNTDEIEADVFSEELLRIGFRGIFNGKEHIWVFRPGAWAAPLKWPEGDKVKWEFQFGNFDTIGLWRHLGVRLPIAEDCGLKSYCCDERPGNHSLKTLAREYCGAGWYDDPLVPAKKTGTMNLLPAEMVDEYNARDVAYTGRVSRILNDKMQREGTASLYRDILIPAFNVYRDSQFRGINIDHAKLIELGWNQWMPRWLEMESALQDEAEAAGFDGRINLNSPMQLGKFFFETVGLAPLKFTPTGRPSTAKDVLDALDHPFATKVREFRALDGIMDYVFSVQSNMKLDGRIHPSALFHNTRTGRRAYHDPAMQTVPKAYTVGEDYARIREVFIPHNPDTHGMMEADLSQAEVWTGYYYSQDETLLSHLESGDVHSATAEGAFKVEREHFSKSEWDVYRQNAKKIRFGLMYGEGAAKLASPPPVGIGGTAEAAQTFIDNFWRTYPKFRRWVLALETHALNDGEVRTLSGRVMRFPIVLDHKALRQAVNFPIQGTVGDDILLAAIELAENLEPFNSFVLLDIHDALWIEYDLRHEKTVARIVAHVMEKPKWPGFPRIPVEIKVGPNIGNLHKIEL